jgi:type III pantothenate kinase
MNLLIDIGNSRLKWAVEREGVITPGESLDYRQPKFSSVLQSKWAAFEFPKCIAIASVATQQALSELFDSIQSLWPGSAPLLTQSTSEALGVKNAYLQPEKLGVDRWLAMIAAHKEYSGNLCVVDCGTAITVDAINSDGKHLGGLISPGLTVMRQSLSVSTARLEFDSQTPCLNMASETGAAIANGTLMAAVGLIESTVFRLDGDFRLILTGGNADMIAPALRVKFIVDSMLVFKGLAALFQAEYSA